MRTNRRTFVQTGLAAAGLGAWAADRSYASPRRLTVEPLPIFLATWGFGQAACKLALRVVEQGGSMLDGIEQGIGLIEADPKNNSVGVGGIPNEDGVVELDACIMTGPGHKAGSVAGLHDILHPVSVARKVMEKTRHVMLVGEGARKFAIEQGFQPTQLLTDEQRAAWEVWKKKRADDQQNGPGREFDKLRSTLDQHDTIAMIGVDQNGDVFGGCSTSGLAYKLAGRVGDSPLIGGGLYVDNGVGGAGATGTGENVLRFCGSFQVVERMRDGLDPSAACREVILRIAKTAGVEPSALDINFIACNKQGVFGGAGVTRGFQYSFANSNSAGTSDGYIAEW